MHRSYALQLAFAVLLAASAGAQTHPRAILTPDRVDDLEAKVVANDADWVYLKGTTGSPFMSCERSIAFTATTGDNLPPVFAPRQPVTSSVNGRVTTGYQGSGYYVPLLNLLVCAAALDSTDPAKAATYRVQALKIVDAMITPGALLTPAVAPAGWNGTTSGYTIENPPTARTPYYVSNEGPGGQANVFMRRHGLAVGATITLSGVTGCTTANGTFKVGGPATQGFLLVETDGTTPVICNAAGTNYNFDFANDDGYSMRYYSVALALAYDWLYDDLSAGQKSAIYTTLNTSVDEFRVVATSYVFAAQNNYHAAYFAGLGLIGILTRGVGENSRGQEFYDNWLDDVFTTQNAAFHARWLGNNGGFPEAFQYQRDSVVNMILPLIAQLDANGSNLFDDFPWIQGLQRYWIHNLNPSKTSFSYRGYVAPHTISTTPNRWSYIMEPAKLVHWVAVHESDSFAPKFKDWVDEMEVFNGSPVTNDTAMWFLPIFWNPSATSGDWSTEGLSLPQMSNPAGGYMHATMRSAWDTTGIFADFWASPYTSQHGNAKERWDRGSLYITRGSQPLTAMGMVFASLAQNTTAYNNWSLWNYFERRKHQGFSLFNTEPSGLWDHQITQYCSPNATYKHPGCYDRWPASSITEHLSRIDRFIDGTAYVYSRAVNLEANYYHDERHNTYFPLKGWTREVLYVRPKVFVVYDRTYKQNDSGAYATSVYQQWQSWVVGRGAVTASYGGGFRTEVDDTTAGVYRGALTYVLPAGMSAPEEFTWDTSANTPVAPSGTSVARQIRFHPPDELTTEKVNWLTVLDAADSSVNVSEVVKLATTSNIDVVRIGSSTLVGWPNHLHGVSVAFPLTYTITGATGSTSNYVSGLAASTVYKVDVTGANVSIDTTGSGSNVSTDAAGVLSFITTDSGSDPVEDLLINTTTLADGAVDVPYSQTPSVSGGTQPYVFSVSGGSLCVGLSLNASTGEVSGTPSVAGPCTFTILVTDDEDDTDSQEYTVTIAAAQVSPLALNVAPGSTAAIYTFGVARMTNDTSCTVSALLPISFTNEASTVSATGRSSRSAYLTGLTADTPYVAEVACDGLATPQRVEFSTTEYVGGTVSWAYRSVPNARLQAQSAAKLKVYYALPGEAEASSTNASCGSGCTVTLSLTSGAIYNIRHQWLTSGDAVLATTQTSPVVVP